MSKYHIPKEIFDFDNMATIEFSLALDPECYLDDRGEYWTNDKEKAEYYKQYLRGLLENQKEYFDRMDREELEDDEPGTGEPVEPTDNIFFF